MNFDKNLPIFRQISSIIMENILTGKYRSEDRIPSVREIAISLEVNPNTILKAYEELETNQIIYKKRGIGYFVAVNGSEKIIALKKKKFIEKTMPQFIKEMRLLSISLQEFVQYYNQCPEQE